MSKTKSPEALEIDESQKPKKLSISEALDKYRDIELDRAGIDALRLVLAYLMDDLDLDNSKLSLLKLMVGQFLPSAGTNVNVNVRITPEEYLVGALRENNQAYNDLVAIAERKALELQASLKARAIDGEYTEIDSAGAESQTP